MSFHLADALCTPVAGGTHEREAALILERVQDESIRTHFLGGKKRSLDQAEFFTSSDNRGNRS
jgi:hypothetical protein